MPASMQLKLQGDRQFELAIGAIVAGFENTEPLAEILGGYLESSTLERFETETAPDGSQWAPSMRAILEGGTTLTKSSQLRSSVHSDPSDGQVEWGSNKIYARPHQEGMTIRPKNADRLSFQLPGGLGFRSVEEVTIPARPFLGINAEDEVELVALAEYYATDLAGGLA